MSKQAHADAEKDPKKSFSQQETTTFEEIPAQQMVTNPQMTAPQTIMSLQRMIGNQAVGRLLSPAPSGTVQRGVKDLIKQHEQQQQESSKSKTSTQLPQTRSGIGDKQTKFNTAMERHKADRAALLKHVERGAAFGQEQKISGGTMSAEAQRRLANSCEWILAGKTKLYALTATGDSSERVTAAGQNPANKVAYFPKGTDGSGTGAVTSSIAPYNFRDLTDNTNVEIDDNNTVGWNGAGFLAVTNPQQRTQEYVWETIRHEVQHDADQNRDKEAEAATQWEYNLEGYKTEYRAYSYEGSAYANLDHDPANLVNKYGYSWTARQLAIFEQIFDEYDHTSDGWGKGTDDKPLAKRAPYGNGAARQRREDRKRFQEAVVAYRNPDTEGFNKWNSVRVDDFYKALKQIPDNTDVGDPDLLVRPLMPDQQKVQNLVDALNQLDQTDAQYILNESPDFDTLINKKLAGVTRSDIRGKLQAV